MDKKIEKQLVDLWRKVGYIVNLSQMVEYNLANILAFGISTRISTMGFAQIE